MPFLYVSNKEIKWFYFDGVNVRVLVYAERVRSVLNFS